MKYIVIIILLLIIMLESGVLNTTPICSGMHMRARKIFNKEYNGNYKLFNPSITHYKGQFLLSARNSNATMKNLWMYITHRFDYNSSIWLLLLNNKFEVKQTVIPTFIGSYPLEDPRIIIVKDKIIISATEVISSKKIYPVLFHLDSDMNVTKRVEYLRSSYHNTSSIQKNWCPFLHKGSVFLHTDADPWCVYSLDIDTGSIQKIVEKKCFKQGKRTYVRCSTSWKEFNTNTYICGVHVKTYDPIFNKLAIIRSVLVEIDKESLIPLRMTGAFCLDRDHHPIQFLSGLEVINDNIILSFGLGDYQSTLYSISKNRIDKMMKVIFY